MKEVSVKDFEITFKRTVYFTITVKAKDKYAAEEEAYEDYDNGYCDEVESHLEMENIREV